ncbi:ESCRT-I subunit protein VPS28 [Ascoidea rubescens DSM 1968]|uniref:Vacuolar protein sorting-associated protein 28 n=1 Tax=Ascoidea rubescens DSM 1968 TaxID=1344418 RepID=A0A1D2VMT1_9ASCO|nr:ESCRT-1 complex, Vps28 subunit [Ascoidea rubescens DSM 1968]ODV62913.1 ESCRT-1 complex, Vps28 subunit [Ascoidea rubescens DSM 1968]
MNNDYLPYAPISNIQNPTYNLLRSNQKLSSINLDQEVSLYSTNSYNTKEREIYENLAEIYSILTTLEYIEKSYLKDNLKHELYTSTVKRLINQYNALINNDEISDQFINLQYFKKKYKIDCPLATKRLEIGESSSSNNNNNNNNANNNNNKNQISSRAVAEATGNFITCMDALKLNYKAKDQLYPLLSDLITSINNSDENNNKQSGKHKLDFEGRGKLVEWLIKLNHMKVNDELSEDEVRQLLFDLDTAYKHFYTSLE